MKGMNKDFLKEEVLKMIVLDKIDFPITVCQNLKLDIVNVLKKYFNNVSDEVGLNIKVLPDSKYQINIKSEASFFLMNGK